MISSLKVRQSLPFFGNVYHEVGNLTLSSEKLVHLSSLILSRRSLMSGERVLVSEKQLPIHRVKSYLLLRRTTVGGAPST